VPNRSHWVAVEPDGGVADRTRRVRARDAEVDNFRGALRWAAGRDTAEPLLMLCAAYGEYWLARYRFADAAAWFEQALSKCGADRHPALRVRALRVMAWALWPLGRGAELPAVAQRRE
jgi:hypothetical protein